jgi:hypothetical protein
MHTWPRLLTADDFAALPVEQGYRLEPSRRPLVTCSRDP